MRNIYNKGAFRAGEYGKIPQSLQKQGNKKWRRTEKSAIDDQLRETTRFFKHRKKSRVLIRVKITKEISGRTDSDYRNFYSEKSFKDSIGRTHITRYFLINQNKKVKE